MKKLRIRGVDCELNLAKIVLGTCYYGTDITRETSFDLMDEFIANGGDCIDTARLYASWLPNGEGASERTIGDWLSERGTRSRVLLSTKGGHTVRGETTPRLAPELLREDIERSLTLLRTDYVDLYFLHRDDPSRPVSEIMDTVARFADEGKIRALGASNWSIERMEQANDYAVANGLVPFTVSQIQWSLARTTPEACHDDIVCMTDEMLACYLALGIPVFAFSSQSKGFFSKALTLGIDGLNDKIRERFLSERSCPERNLASLARVKALSEKTGLSPAVLTLLYICCNPLEGAAIVGCSNVAQLADSMAALTSALSDEDLNYLIG